MCGIIAIAGTSAVSTRLVKALKRLEYRGYDSSGIAVLASSGVERRRAAGRIANLEAVIKQHPVDGMSGIAHTRWATHGPPSEANAHPHMAGSVAIVHNGIIENYAELKAALQSEGAVFESQTDSEVIAQLIHKALSQGLEPKEAFFAALHQMEGAFAIAALIGAAGGTVFGARRGSPMVVGLHPTETYIASDALALAGLSDQVIYLEEGDRCIATPAAVQVFDGNGTPVQRATRKVNLGATDVSIGQFSHFMEKEIFDQPEAVRQTLEQAIDPSSGKLLPFAELEALFATAKRGHFISCGTAYHAALTGSYWFEALADLSTKCEVSSEFRYRQPVLRQDEFVMVVSQSGETADTLAALRHGQGKGLATLGVVNVPESAIWREARHRLPTMAGPEIGVASTKAYTAQLTALAVLTLLAGRARGALNAEQVREHIHDLMLTPQKIAQVLATVRPLIREVAQAIKHHTSVLFMGRGDYFPLSIEAALKLKEISYIHAEGFAAGELKHGSIALIDREAATPVVVIAPSDAMFRKTLSNLEEVRARGASVLLITDAEGRAEAGDSAKWVVEVPDAGRFGASILAAVPLQLLAYEVAVARGHDVDKPRNLAKSVTVE